MIYNYRCNPNINKINNINSSLPTWKKNLYLSNVNNEIYNTHHSKIALNPVLPYLFPRNEIEMNSLFNSYQLGYINNPYYYNNFYPNFKIPKICLGLPVTIHKAQKLKIKNFTPTLTKTNFINKGIKKNMSNLIVSNIIREANYTPPKINSPVKITKKDDFKKKKTIRLKNYEKIIKRNKTEDNLEPKIKPFFPIEMKKNNSKKWWDLFKYFIRIYYFFSILRKYTNKIHTIRQKEINQMDKNIQEDILKIKNWILDIQGKFWDNLIENKNINLSFIEKDTKDKIKNNSKIIIQLIDIYLYNLRIKTYDIIQIPKDIRKIIYKYIKKNAFFPSQYLNLFHIKRLNFDFYGCCTNKTSEESGLNFCYFIISYFSVQQILLNIKSAFKKLKLKCDKNIEINAKYISSILYYLQREAFEKIKINNGFINLANYFRSYKLKNTFIENEKDIKILLGINKSLSIVKYNEYNEDINNDIYNKFLIDDKIIDKFWEYNVKEMKKFSKSLYIWSLNTARLILDEFENKY